MQEEKLYALVKALPGSATVKFGNFRQQKFCQKN